MSKYYFNVDYCLLCLASYDFKSVTLEKRSKCFTSVSEFLFTKIYQHIGFALNVVETKRKTARGLTFTSASEKLRASKRAEVVGVIAALLGVFKYRGSWSHFFQNLSEASWVI